MENTTDEVALQLNANKDTKTPKKTQTKLAKLKIIMKEEKSLKPIQKTSTLLKPRLKKKERNNVVERMTKSSGFYRKPGTRVRTRDCKIS